jgi:GntR family phosphonate transport system transcriptional regulator
MLTRTRDRSGKDHLLARGITLWRCIADDFEQMILIGKHGNGERLPSEAEIAGRCGARWRSWPRAAWCKANAAAAPM